LYGENTKLATVQHACDAGRSAHTEPALTDYWAHSCSQQAYCAPVNPVIHVPNCTDHYSFTDPWGMDGWVGHVGWSIADGLTVR